MKRTIVLCVLVMSAIAHAQQASAPASQDQAPKDPVGHPCTGPQTRFYGPRQPIRLDIKTMIAARSDSIVIAGKTYEFAGSPVPTEDGMLLWMGVDVKDKDNAMDLVRNLGPAASVEGSWSTDTAIVSAAKAKTPCSSNHSCRYAQPT